MVADNNINKKIAHIARAMECGDLNYFSGAIQLVELRHDVGAYENDPDFVPFLAVVMELDNLELVKNRADWTDALFQTHEEKLRDSLEWAKEFTMEHCRNLIRRFAK